MPSEPSRRSSRPGSPARRQSPIDLRDSPCRSKLRHPRAIQGQIRGHGVDRQGTIRRWSKTWPLRGQERALGANVFDHRLMVPLTIYGVTAYLTLYRTWVPEFRSTRENREDLWDFAAALESGREHAPRRSRLPVYTAADFKDGAAGGVPWRFGPEEVVDLEIFFIPPFLAGREYASRLGGRSTCALTIRISRRSSALVSSSSLGPWNAGPRPGRRSAWIPPAKPPMPEPAPPLRR